MLLRRRAGRLWAMRERKQDRHAAFALVRILIVLGFGSFPWGLLCEAPPSALRAFEEYTARVEARLSQQHRLPDTFLVEASPKTETEARLRRGALIIEHISPESEKNVPGAMLHHWRGTAFVPGATADSFERLMKNFADYPQYFSPEVVRARILTPHAGTIPDRFVAVMRVRQKHVITVVMDTTYDIVYGRLDAKHRYSVSRSRQVSEIASPGTAREHALSSTEDHGFLWRLNTYWSYEERDGGLYIQIESVSLSRSVPNGLGWAVRPYVESVPRDSLEFTLRSTINALKNNGQENGG